MLRKLSLRGLKLKKLRIWQKLALASLAMSFPVPFIVYSFVSAETEGIKLAQQELIGIAYLEQIRPLYEHLPQHRGWANAYLNGDSTVEERLLGLQPTIDRDFAALEEADLQYGALLGTTERLRASRRSWGSLKDRVQELTPLESFDRHSKLIYEIQELIRRIADNAEMARDPDLDSVYLIENTAKYIPGLAENLAQIRGLGVGFAQRSEMRSDESTILAAISREAQLNLEEIRRGMEIAYEFNTTRPIDAGPPLREQLDAEVLSAMNGTGQTLEAVDEGFLRTNRYEVDSDEFFAIGTGAVDRVMKLYSASLAQLRRQVEARLEAQTMTTNFTLLAMVAVFLMAVAAVFFINRSITRQAEAVSRVFSRIGMGDFEARAKVFSEDELGTTATALNAMLDNTLDLVQSREEKDKIQASILKLLEEVGGVAQGDLTVEAEVTADMTGAIADSFNFMIGELRKIIDDVQNTTGHVSSAASEIRTTAEGLAVGIDSQTRQIVDTTQAVNEMALSIQEVSANATRSNQVAERARSTAVKGDEAVSKTIAGMNSIRQRVQETSKRIKRLGESSQQISEAVQLIGDIADRTSILALNASIQAAMAGEAGRGFAVVAEEVERLAERAAESTKRIGTLIKTIQTETNEAVVAMEDTTREVVEGSTLANEAGEALAEIQGVSTQLAELIHSITEASNQQAMGAQSVTTAMSEISQVTQQTSAGTKQAAESINELSSMADELRTSVSRFRVPAA